MRCLWLRKGTCNINIVVHGLQEGVEGVELALESYQPSKSDYNLLTVKELIPEIMKDVHFNSSRLLEVLIMRIRPETACSSITLPVHKVKINEIDSVRVTVKLLLEFRSQLNVSRGHTKVLSALAFARHNCAFN